MTRFIVFANRKGGCGKTTTAVNVAHALAMKGKNVLLLDADPQAHTTISLGIAADTRVPGMYHLLKDEADVKDVITETHLKQVSLIPSSRYLLSYETESGSRENRITCLSDKLSGIGSFDYLIFDPPPTAGILTLSVLAAAREVFIPMQMSFLNLEGLAEMVRLIYDIRAAWNSDLALAGIIPTFFNRNTRIAKEISDDIAAHFGSDKLFPGIRMNISLTEAPGHGQTIFEYAPESAGAADYKELANEIDSRWPNIPV